MSNIQKLNMLKLIYNDTKKVSSANPQDKRFLLFTNFFKKKYERTTRSNKATRKSWSKNKKPNMLTHYTVGGAYKIDWIFQIAYDNLCYFAFFYRMRQEEEFEEENILNDFLKIRNDFFDIIFSHCKKIIKTHKKYIYTPSYLSFMLEFQLGLMKDMNLSNVFLGKDIKEYNFFRFIYNSSDARNSSLKPEEKYCVMYPHYLFSDEVIQYNMKDGFISVKKIDELPSHSEIDDIGEYIYVILPDGELILSSQHMSRNINHSYLANGQPVICAGELTIKDKKIIRMNNKSGHYSPSFEMLKTGLIAINHLYKKEDEPFISEWY
jgi:hypothetical protein